MSISLQDLPYPLDALEPHMSKRTLEYHYGKHHAGYVKNLNKLIEGTPYSAMSLEDIVRNAEQHMDVAIFNNAAQVFNHEFFWNSMSPTGATAPNGRLANAIERDFGSIDDLKKEFRFSAATLFGSGWVWLVSDAGKLRIITSANAGTPLEHGLVPLLTLDVWEHAYYLDVQNNRAGYIDAFLEELADWSGASERYQELREAA
jgi:Fe-Mn family superoxide dismutase